jgi:multiple sugar transport system permease protein/sn-glycerol 3-phosphate transport system permease protein
MTGHEEATISTGADTAAGRTLLRRGARRRARRDGLTFIAFVAPNFLLLAVFTFWPVLYSFYLSFFKWNMIAKRKTFLALGNYRTMIADPVFWIVVRNTFALAAAAVVVTLAIALTLAVLLNRRMPGRSLYRAVIFSPTFTTSVAVAMVWGWIFEPNYGLLRVFLKWLAAVAELVHRRALALPAIMIVVIWGGWATRW